MKTKKSGAGLGTDATTSTTTKAADTKHSIPADLLEALSNGEFRLASRCDVCGHWLTSAASLKRHRGPRCAAREGGAI